MNYGRKNKMLDTLPLVDIVELVALCGILFIPVGFFLRKTIDKYRVIFRLSTKFHSKLKDKGAFKDFIKK